MTVVRLLGVGVVVIAAVSVAGLFLFQRCLLFPRPPVPAGWSRPEEAQQVWFPISGGSAEAWYLPPLRSSRQPAPLIIYFHGNGELIDLLPEDFGEPRHWGVGVLLVEFPGYGRSGGSPSQSSVAATARLAFAWAKSQPAIDAERIVAYGRSLGGAAAAILAAERTTRALILESTFTSVRSFAHSFWMPELAVRDPFDTLALLPTYRQPILLLHGRHDSVVPPTHATLLARSAPQAELQLMNCGHNDCVHPWPLVRRFLVGAGVLLTAEAPIRGAVDARWQ